MILRVGKSGEAALNRSGPRVRTQGVTKPQPIATGAYSGTAADDNIRTRSVFTVRTVPVPVKTNGRRQ